MHFGNAWRQFENRLRWFLFGQILAIENPRSRAYDAEHGVETAKEEQLGEVGVATQDVSRGNSLYRVTWGSLIDKAMGELRIDHSRYAFIDYGSGKGKVMLMASDYPFKRIIGLEYADKLHALACANCSTYASARQKCHEFEPILIDVLDYEPPKGPIICFMCNPFDQATTRLMFDCWRARYESGERDIRIMYLNMRSIAEMSPVLDDQDWLRPVARGMRYVILAPRNPPAELRQIRYLASNAARDRQTGPR